MRVQASAVSAGTGTVTRLGHVPVLVAIGSVAVRAEPCIVVEPGGVYLDEGQGRPERMGDLLCPARVYGVAVTVVGGNALEEEIPLSWLTLQQEGALLCAVLGQCSHSAGSSPGATSSMRVEGDPHSAQSGVVIIPVTMRPE